MSEAPYRRLESARTEAFMNPSRYRIPQHTSADRQRGRRAVLAAQRERYELKLDDCPGNPTLGFLLPPYLKSLPAEARFSAPKLGRFLSHKLVAKFNFAFVGAVGPWGFKTFDDYARVFRLIPPPGVKTHGAGSAAARERAATLWRTDAEFARQRVSGVNPMSLRRSDAGYDMGPELTEATQRILAGYNTNLKEAHDEGRLFFTRYHTLADPRIQARVLEKKSVLASPTCIFYVDRARGLMPVAIQLRAPGSKPNPVFTPKSPPLDWLAAKLHAQAADAHIHEGVYHLLDTHLVTETIAVCAARELHPDHPIAQLLKPHFEFNLALNNLARRDLLGPGGPIEATMAAGVSGVLDAARMSYAQWDFAERSVPQEIKRRGLDDLNVWPEHAWRDNAQPLWKAIDTFVRKVLSPWYQSDSDVEGDFELQRWVAEIASPRSGGIPGFPSALKTFDAVVEVVREVFYRATAGHAAVNNGQFDAYGFIPNCPGGFNLALPTNDTPRFTEEQLVGAMPDRFQTAQQISMTWILSEPTQRSLMRTGEMPAFARSHCWAAYDAVIAFRQALMQIQEKCDERNEKAREESKIPYRYLDPWNVSRSIET